MMIRTAPRHRMTSREIVLLAAASSAAILGMFAIVTNAHEQRSTLEFLARTQATSDQARGASLIVAVNRAVSTASAGEAHAQSPSRGN